VKWPRICKENLLFGESKKGPHHKKKKKKEKKKKKKKKHQPQTNTPNPGKKTKTPRRSYTLLKISFYLSILRSLVWQKAKQLY